MSGAVGSWLLREGCFPTSAMATLPYRAADLRVSLHRHTACKERRVASADLAPSVGPATVFRRVGRRFRICNMF